MRMRTVLAGLALTSAVAAGCGDDGGGGGGGGLSASGFSLEAALAELPASAATGANIQVSAGDLSAASEYVDEERPDGGGDTEALVAWTRAVTGASGEPGADVVFVPLAEVFNYQQLVDIDEFDAELGWSLLDVDAFVELSTPPHRFSVLSGDFDDGFPASGLIEQSEGLFSAGERDDLEVDPQGGTAARPLGRSLHMATEGDRMAASLIRPDLEAWMAGPDETLADNAGLAAVARALDDNDLIGAFVHQGDMEMGGDTLDNAPPQVLEEAREDTIPVAFDTVGIGWSVEDDEAVVTVAYHLPSGEAEGALDAVEAGYTDGVSFATGQPISELVRLDDIAADDDVVVATVTMPGDRGPSTVFDMLRRRDLPFVHS